LIRTFAFFCQPAGRDRGKPRNPPTPSRLQPQSGFPPTKEEQSENRKLIFEKEFFFLLVWKSVN
jgi:hypothetical protein